MTGIVESDKMNKTVKVRVELTRVHAKYHKRYRIHRTYFAHDQNQEFKIGDKVEIEESRPMSKNKRWTVTKKI